MKKLDYLTIGDLKKRGWVSRLIVQFMPIPDLVQNPKSNRRPLVKLYEISHVEAIEQADAFKFEMNKINMKRISRITPRLPEL